MVVVSDRESVMEHLGFRVDEYSVIDDSSEDLLSHVNQHQKCAVIEHILPDRFQHYARQPCVRKNQGLNARSFEELETTFHEEEIGIQLIILMVVSCVD